MNIKIKMIVVAVSVLSVIISIMISIYKSLKYDILESIMGDAGFTYIDSNRAYFQRGIIIISANDVYKMSTSQLESMMRKCDNIVI